MVGASLTLAMLLGVLAPDSPEYYEALVNMYTPGIWRIGVGMSISLGRVFVEVPPVEVPRLRGYMSGSFVFIGLTLVVILAGGTCGGVLGGSNGEQQRVQPMKDWVRRENLKISMTDGRAVPGR